LPAAATNDYFTYRKWFDGQYNVLTFPNECSEPEGPTFAYSNQYTWSMEWFLTFNAAPESYVRVWEHFAKRSGLSLSRCISFAYHFGPILRKDKKGIPERESSDPVFVRIDNHGGPAHLHPEGHPDRHVMQSAVDGLVLQDIDLFAFVKAVLRQRQTRRSIADELGYRIN
jgi:hypothetical protein